MGRTGVVVGMIAEAECLAGLGLPVVCSGARPALAKERTEALVAAGARALVCFGLSGALVPGLEPGALILPPAVVVPGSNRVLAVDRAWHARVARALPRARTALVAGSDQAEVTAAAKSALAAATGAVAVDMESHVVAAVAAERGLPFLILRAIADPATRAIPAQALLGLGPDGETRPWNVARGLLTAPWALPGLLRLAADSRTGLTALRQAVASLGPPAFRFG